MALQTCEFVKLLLIVLYLIIFITLISCLYKEFCGSLFKGNQPLDQKKERIENGNLKTIVLWTISSRLLIFLIGYMGIMLIKNEEPGLFNSFKWIWNKWDAPHYLDIAKNWYQNDGDERFFIVFYPLYPLLIKLLHLVIGDYFVCGIIISNVFLILSCIYLYKIVILDFDEKIALNSIKYLLIFPYSFFLGIAYPESLFICLSIVTFYQMRKNKWFSACLFAFFATLSRPFGILLLIPLGIELLLLIKRERIKLREFFAKITFLLLIPLAQFIYLFINKLITGSYFTYLKYLEEHWHCKLGFWADVLKVVFNYSVSAKPTDRICLWLPQLFFIFVAIVLIFYSFKKLRIPYTSYMFAYLLLLTSHTWLLSAPRYIMGIFPIYVLLAIMSKNSKLDFIFTFASLFLLCFYTIAFVSGYYVM